MLRTHTPLALAGCVLATGVAGAVVLAGGSGHDVRPGAEADDPHCARIAARAPERLGGHARRDAGAPGVVVWGDGDVVLRCGVAEPGPTGDPCFAADGVDWVIDGARSGDSRKVITTYGRSPATEVTFVQPVNALDAALVDLSALLAPVRQTEECLGYD